MAAAGARPSEVVTRLTYGATGALVCLVFAWPAGVLTAGAGDMVPAVLAAIAIWLVGTTTSVRLPPFVLERVHHRLARLLVAPILVGITVLVTGVGAAAAATVLQSDSRLGWITLVVAVGIAGMVAPLGLVLQGGIELVHHLRHTQHPGPDAS